MVKYMGEIKINNEIYGTSNSSNIVYKDTTVEEKLDTIPVFDINDNGNVDNDGSDVLTYGHIIDNLESDADDKVLSAKQGKVLNNKIDNIDFSPLENSISSLENELEESINNLDTKITEFQNTFLNLVYPIGAIYLSLSNTNPGTLFGGTWEQLKDRFLLGAGSSYSVGGTGGEATHTLTEAELPNIQGTLPHMAYGEYKITGVFTFEQAGASNYEAKNSDTKNTSRYLMNFGNNEAHNNMPPYLTVYMWKRVS